MPDYCWYDILDGVQDISSWMHDTCDNAYGDAEDPTIAQFYQSENKKSKVYAFPRFEHWNRSRTDFIHFIDAISDSIQDYAELTDEERNTT